jgi:TolB-like protein/Tfp pilus assembly protein PilF
MSDAPQTNFFQELKRRNVFRVGIAFVIVAWLLLQLVDILVPMLALPEWVGRFVILLLLIAFPIALIFAWAFEMTPEGVKLEKNVDRSQSVTHQTGRKLDFTIIGVLVAALGISLYVNFDDDKAPSSEIVATPAPADTSIAVLPFANRSNNEDDAFFVDGMHDDLLTQLAKISALKVISRTSVMQYRDTEKTMRTIGDELGVSTLLEGGVQRSGDRIRINVQLIDANTDEHIWAETYNRELTAANLFEIQEEITSEIATALQAALSPVEKQRIASRPTDNLQAYEAYMIGRQKMANRTSADLAEAERQFERAIELDPEFVLGYVGLAETLMILNNSGTLARDDMLRRVRPLVATARRLEGGNISGPVYSAMGGLSEYEGDIRAAEQYYRKAIVLSPEYMTARHWLALLLTLFAGELEEAEAIYREAVELDPLAAVLRSNHAYTLSSLGKHAEAMEEIKIALAVNPALVDAYETAGAIQMYGFGNLVAGLRWWQQATKVDQLSGFNLAQAYISLGDIEAAKMWNSYYSEVNVDSAIVLISAMNLMIATGQQDKAVALAEKSLTYSFDVIYPPYSLHILRNAELQNGDYDSPYRRYFDYYPDLLSPDPDLHSSNIEVAVDLILVLRGLGRNADANRLAESALSLSELSARGGFYSNRLLRAEVYALQADREAALASIRTRIDSGWSSYWTDRPDKNPNLRLLHGDPEFLAMMNEVKARIAGQLEQVRSLEAAGKLAATPEQLDSISFDLGI